MRPERRHRAAGRRSSGRWSWRERGRGGVSPNPLVGAVIVDRDGRVARRGLPRRARRAARRGRRRSRTPASVAPTRPGRRMYVTLEPCAHQGRQPPCTDAILAAGIAPRRDRLRRPEREGRAAAAPASSATAASRSTGPTAPPRRRGPPPQPAVPQALPHRPAAGRPQVGADARRQDRDRGGRLEVDLRRGVRASSSIAGGPSPMRSRSGSAPRSPTTPCSPPAGCRSAASRAGRLRLDGAAAARREARHDRGRGARASDRRPGGARRPRRRADRRRRRGDRLHRRGRRPDRRRARRARPSRDHQRPARGRRDARRRLPRRRRARRAAPLLRSDRARRRRCQALARRPRLSADRPRPSGRSR